MNWRPIQKTLAEFHAEYAGLEEFVDRLLDDLDLLHGQLEAKARELASQRSRAAELTELVAEQRREMQQYQQETKRELQQLRELVELQAELLRDATNQRRAEAAAAESTVPAAPTVGAVETKPEVRDPVVNSVVAQFAKLQHDIAQRRKSKSSVN